MIDGHILALYNKITYLMESPEHYSKVDPPQYTWHSLTLARPLTKLVTGHFLRK